MLALGQQPRRDFAWEASPHDTQNYPVFICCQEALIERVKAILVDWGVVPEAAHLGATYSMAESRVSRDQAMAVLGSAGYAVESIEADTHVRAEANCLLFATLISISIASRQ